MRRYCFALDLVDDPGLIAEYIDYHRQVWPHILQTLKDAGIEAMEIYHVADRLFLIMDVSESFSLERKAAADREDPKVQEWETLMWKYQRAIPGTAPGQKWRLMERVFEL
jgi:L-rhamnose mutarotase